MAIQHELNFNNYKIWDFNLIYNNKSIFWIKQLSWYDLQKKSNRENILDDFRSIIHKTNEESKNCYFPYTIHNIKIKRKLDIWEYLNFLDFVQDVLKAVNPDLYDKYTTTYIPYLREELNQVVSNNNVYSYYYAISYWESTEKAWLYKDHYFFKKLDIDKDQMEILLMKTDELLKFNDWSKYKKHNINDMELNVSMFLQNFFPNNRQNSISFDIDLWKEIIKNLRNDYDLVTYFENYLKVEYEDFIAKSMSKYKYKNKLWYNLIKIYEEYKRKFLWKIASFDDMASLEIKEWLNFLKIEPYFVKMYFIHPEKQDLLINKVEDIFSPSWWDNAWFLIQYTSSTPLKWSALEAEYENIVAKVWWNDEGERKQTIDNIQGYMPYWIWKTCHYYIVFAEREEMFAKIEQKLNTLKKGHNIWYNVDNNISYFVPWWRNNVHNFYTFGYHIPWTDNFINNPNDTFFNYYPKNIIYQKWIFLWYNLDTFYPIFYQPFDTEVINNKNMFIVWRSWSWKTYMTRLMIERWLSYMKYIVIDHLNNYNKHCELLWWKVLYLKKEKVNFLYLDYERFESKEELTIILQEHIDAMAYLLSMVWKFDTKEEDFLKIILNSAYNNKTLKGKVKLKHLQVIAHKYFEKYKEKLDPTQKTILQTVIKRFENIATWSLWTYLNSDYVIDFESVFKTNNYVVLNFAEIDPNSPLFQIFGYYVFSNLRKYAYTSLDDRIEIIQKNHQTIDPWRYKWSINVKLAQPMQVIIDEVWQYTKDNYIWRILFDFAKAIRNKEWGIISITQEITDLIKSEHWWPLFSQVDTYLLLKWLKEEDMNIIMKMLESKEDWALTIDSSDKAFLMKEWLWEWLFKYWVMPIQKVKIYWQDYASLFGVKV